MTSWSQVVFLHEWKGAWNKGSKNMHSVMSVTIWAIGLTPRFVVWPESRAICNSDETSLCQQSNLSFQLLSDIFLRTGQNHGSWPVPSILKRIDQSNVSQQQMERTAWILSKAAFDLAAHSHSQDSRQSDSSSRLAKNHFILATVTQSV
jgi:hypothetical protein